MYRMFVEPVMKYVTRQVPDSVEAKRRAFPTEDEERDMTVPNEESEDGKKRLVWLRERREECLNLFAFARKKLLLEADPNKPMRHYSKSAQIAVLASRLHLAFDQGRRLVSDKQSEWVASHMAMVYSIPQHREYLFSGWSPEPVIGEAAARQLAVWKSHYTHGHPAIDILYQALEDDLLDRREIGGAVARLFTMIAHDDAVGKEQGDADCQYSQPISVASFIECLLTAGASEDFLESRA